MNCLGFGLPSAPCSFLLFVHLWLWHSGLISFFFFFNSTILLKTISTFFRKPLTEGVVHWHPGIDVYWSSDRTTMFPLISFHFLWFLTVGIQKNTGTDFFLTFRFHLFPFMRTDQRFPFLSKHNSSTTLSRFVLGEVVLTLIWFLSLYSDPHSNPSHVICRAMRSQSVPGFDNPKVAQRLGALQVLLFAHLVWWDLTRRLSLPHQQRPLRRFASYSSHTVMLCAVFLPTSGCVK